MMMSFSRMHVVCFSDGTTNFAHGYPSFAVSVGVLFRGKPAAASVVRPNLGVIYFTAVVICTLCFINV